MTRTISQWFIAQDWSNIYFLSHSDPYVKIELININASGGDDVVDGVHTKTKKKVSVALHLIHHLPACRWPLMIVSGIQDSLQS